MKAARLLVLIVAIAAGGAAALMVGRGGHVKSPKQAPAKAMSSVDVLVAKKDIGTGQTISPQDVAWEAWPASAKVGNFIRKKDHPRAIDTLSGTMARAPFVSGEPIREAKLVRANGYGYMAAILPAGKRAVAIGISAETAASGFILPDDHVDVILTRRDQQAEKATGISPQHTVKTILSDVRVLAINQTLGEKNGQKAVVGRTATLELTPRQADTIELARQTGKLSLVLRSVADNGKGKSKPTPTRNDRVVVYRGLAREAYSCVPECK